MEGLEPPSDTFLLEFGGYVKYHKACHFSYAYWVYPII